MLGFEEITGMFLFELLDGMRISLKMGGGFVLYLVGLTTCFGVYMGYILHCCVVYMQVGKQAKNRKLMIYLIWSIINGIIVLYFIFLIIGFIVKGKKIFKPQFKFFSIAVMVIGIVQIISASNAEKIINRITITEDYNNKNNSEIKKVTLEDNLTFDINILVKYSVDQNEFIPIESNSFLSGLVNGFVWQFESIQTNNFKPNEKTEFIAEGILKWNLFGICVFNESKIFSGTIE